MEWGERMCLVKAVKDEKGGMFERGKSRMEYTRMCIL